MRRRAVRELGRLEPPPGLVERDTRRGSCGGAGRGVAGVSEGLGGRVELRIRVVGGGPRANRRRGRSVGPRHGTAHATVAGGRLRAARVAPGTWNAERVVDALRSWSARHGGAPRAFE